jgi:hypothetical protein
MMLTVDTLLTICYMCMTLYPVFFMKVHNVAMAAIEISGALEAGRATVE